MNDFRVRWINEGYSMLAEEGPDCIQIEKLARKIGTNKSSFYHYFVDRDIFFDELIQHHIKKTKKFNSEVNLIKYFDPDFFKLLVEYKDTFFVNMHISMLKKISVFNESFNLERNWFGKKIISLWAEYINIADNWNLAFEIWKIVSDSIYVRIKYNDMNVESICNVIKDIKGIFENYKKMS